MISVSVRIRKKVVNVMNKRWMRVVTPARVAKRHSVEATWWFVTIL